MLNLAELLGVTIFIAIFFTILWLYIRHRIWQKNQILQARPPFGLEGNRSQLQYPNAERFPSYLGRSAPVSSGILGRRDFARRYQGRSSNVYNQPPPIMVFTVSIPEEDEEEDAPPSYEEVIKQSPSPPPLK